MCTLEQDALGFLRGEDNPFDLLVASPHADHDFDRWHSPEVHQSVHATVRAAIAKYARPDYRGRHDLHPTRVLVLRGARGAGKTHLLHAIQYDHRGKHQLLVRPHYFEKQYPFAEYMLKEIVRTLLASGDPESSSPLAWLAEEVTRRLLVEAASSMSVSRWLRWTAKSGVAGVLFGRSYARQQGRQAALIDALNKSSQMPVREACARTGVDLETALCIISWHVDRSEKGANLRVRLRRRLLAALVELSFSGEMDSLAGFLENGFAELEGGLPPSRAALVDDLLRTLVEVLAAVAVPVIVAFDNMERLLAPHGSLELAAAQAFFAGLAQLIDSTPGLLVLLLVEDGLWLQCTQQAIDRFASDRLLLGIRIRDVGLVSELELVSPSAADLEAIVRRRMQPFRERFNGSEKLPPLFPFSEHDIHRLAAHSNDVLRASLLRLRDRFDEIVLPAAPLSACVTQTTRGVGDAPATSISQVQIDREFLQPKWEAARIRSLRRLEATPRGSLALELHAGLGRWLGQLIRVPLAGNGMASWRLVDVETGRAFGDHPSFGLITVAHWRRDSDGCPRRVGMALVLAQGPRMPRDLAVKLSVFHLRPPLIDELVVFWVDRDYDMDPATLPPASRRTWESEAAGRRAQLVGLPLADQAWLLGFNEWLSDVAQCARPGWPEDAVDTFLRSQTQALRDQLVGLMGLTGVQRAV